MNKIAALKTSHRIRLLNDNFRTTFVGGRVHLTHGVSEMPIDVKAQALLKVQSFEEFTEGNDPYGEHDFGSFEVNDVGKVFWKIDYYDKQLERGSEDPSDPAQTTRVLTIMLAEEH